MHISGFALASTLNPEHIGFFGFSRGGYTGLVVAGGNPDLRKLTALCRKILQPPIVHSCGATRSRRWRSHMIRASYDFRRREASSLRKNTRGSADGTPNDNPMKARNRSK